MCMEVYNMVQHGFAVLIDEYTICVFIKLISFNGSGDLE